MAREPAVTARAGRPVVGRHLPRRSHRLTGPQRLFRIATRDVETDGPTSRKGEWVALFFGSANHDPAVFPNPSGWT